MSHRHLNTRSGSGAEVYRMMCEAIKAVQKWDEMSWNNSDHTVQPKKKQKKKTRETRLACVNRPLRVLLIHSSSGSKSTRTQTCQETPHRHGSVSSDVLARWRHCMDLFLDLGSNRDWILRLYTASEILNMLKCIIKCKQTTIFYGAVFKTDLILDQNILFQYKNTVLIAFRGLSPFPHTYCATNTNKRTKMQTTIKPRDVSHMCSTASNYCSAAWNYTYMEAQWRRARRCKDAQLHVHLLFVTGFLDGISVCMNVAFP